MTTTLRAAVAVAALAGFYLVALVAVGGLALLAVLAFTGGYAAAGAKIALAAVIAAAGLAVALWRVARATPPPPDGVPVPEHTAPELWATVRELAGVAGTRPPDEIRLVAEVNAAVEEETRLMGLVGGTRRLYVGVPVLMGLDVAQLRSVLGHELGHWSSGHSRLGPVVHRGRHAVMATCAQTEGTLVGWLLRWYAAFYLMVSATVNRGQELEADAVAVRVAGRAATRSALAELHVLDTAWSFYEGAYLGGGWEIGLAPTADGFFTGFGELVHARREELGRVRTEGPPDDASRWDTHPSLARRIAAVDAVAVPEPVRAPDGRPAVALVPGARAAAAAVAEATFAVADKRRVGWGELTSRAVAAQEQRAADAVLRAAARLTGRAWGSTATVLDLLAAGRGDELGAQIGVDLRAPASDGVSHPLADPVVTVLMAAAVQSGVAGWRHSWGGPAQLVDRSGRPVHLMPLAARAVDPRAAAEVRQGMLRLGVDVERTGQAEQRAGATGAVVLGGLANVQVDGAWHDVVVTDRGLVLAAGAKKTDGGRKRLQALLASAPVDRLAQQHRWLPFEEVADATVRRKFPLRVALRLHDGTTVELKEALAGEQLASDSGPVLLQLLAELAPHRTRLPA